MTTIYKTAKSSKGSVFGLGHAPEEIVDENKLIVRTGKTVYSVWRQGANYERGRIRNNWGYIAKNLSLDEAAKLFEKCTK